MTPSAFTILILFLSFLPIILCWSSEDLELFDLVESSNEKFYDILGVDPKASAGDIRKAYRRLSAVYHPDRNKDADAEQTFRKIAAIADVLRNEERRKKYDLILQTGLPDWRQPIYYYRRVKNMGLLQLVIFLLVLFTVGQYLLAWSAYWEKKYEMEELVLSKLKKKAKHQRKGRLTQADGDMYVAEITCNLPKPRCQDLFPVRLFYYFMHMLKLTPHYIKIFQQCFCSKVTKTNVVEEEEEEESQETRFKTRKYIKPPIPDYSETDSQDHVENMHVEDIYHDHQGSQKLQKKSCLLNPNETDFHELKKAMKKYPNGTLQRWEKIAGVLGCSTSEVATMAKHMKSLPYSRSIPISVQGLTGAQEENVLLESHEKTTSSFYLNLEQTSNSSCKDSSLVSEDKSYSNGIVSKNFNSENFWKQEQQLALEIALQKFPKDVKARWDKIAASIPGKTKEECIARYKLLVQQIKKKKSKET